MGHVPRMLPARAHRCARARRPPEECIPRTARGEYRGAAVRALPQQKCMACTADSPAVSANAALWSERCVPGTLAGGGSASDGTRGVPV
eukprot:COSAG02_NODE_6682_length_3421_cov_2.125828_3_plen_89_part_00